MVIEKHFVKENVQKLIVRKYIEDNLSKVGCGSVDIHRSPLGMRVTIFAEKPGLIIGRKGKSIQKLTDTLRDDFKLENPQIEVLEIQKPELNAVLMAQRIANAIERGIHFRRAVYSTMKTIQDCGALGVEVTVSGKISGERARAAKFTNGFIKHSGELTEAVLRQGFAIAKTKPGVMGIKVKITPPDAPISEVQIRGEELAKPKVDVTAIAEVLIEDAAKAPVLAEALVVEAKALEAKIAALSEEMAGEAEAKPEVKAATAAKEEAPRPETKEEAKEEKPKEEKAEKKETKAKKPPVKDKKAGEEE